MPHSDGKDHRGKTHGLPQHPTPVLINVVKQETADLDTYASKLTETDKDKPSSANGWTVADIIAHAALGAESYALLIRRALQGDVSPPSGIAPVKPYLNPEVSQGILDRTVTFRKSQGPKLMESFRQRCDDLNLVLDSLTPADYQRPCFHRIALTTIHGLILTRISEVCLHTWDMKAGLEPSPRLSQRALAPLLEWLPRWFTWGFFPDKPLAKPLRYRFDVGEPAPCAWDLVVYGDRFQVEAPAQEKPALTFKADPENTVLTFMGRIPWEPRWHRGANRLAIRGDMHNAATFFHYFRSV